MGKGMRLKEQRAIAAPKVIGTIAINMLSDGNVSLSTPSIDPAFLGNAMGKAIQALIQINIKQAKEGDGNRIVTPGPGLILPK